MSPFPCLSLVLSSVLICALAADRARAQSAPAAPPAHSHAPAASSHDAGTVTLDRFVASATPFPRNQVELAQSTTVLDGRSLLLKQQATLGETLAAETGMSATSFGPGASRPVIRGLGDDRIRLLENGVGTLDASVTSPDHAVSVEPFLVERVEIVRGPAALLYGGNALGGAVNVITHRIETDLPTQPVRGAAEFRHGGAAGEFVRGGLLDLAAKPSSGSAIVLHLDGSRREADDTRIPGFAESHRLRTDAVAHARENREPAPVFARGRLPNSSLDSESAAAGLSFVSQNFHAGLSHSGLNTHYGVPGHAHAGEEGGTRIRLRQRRDDLQAEWHGEAGPLQGVRLKIGRARYRHTEFEPDGSPGTRFANDGHDARLEFLHGDTRGWSGAAGLQSQRSDFDARGEEAFLPRSTTRSTALFVFEELARGPVTWQLGGRLEGVRVAPASGRARRDDLFSGSAGAVWKLDSTHALALSLTRTSRMPSAQELFANGPHAGTQTFEIGDASLRPERALGLEASLRRREGRVTGALTVFTHRFSGYLFARPTGLVALEHDGDWDFAPPTGDDDALPVHRYVQSAARFHGVELETLWHLHEHHDWQLDLRLAAEITRGRDDAGHLPRIPPARLTAGLHWAHEDWSAGTDCQWHLAQNRVSANETPSAGYALVSAHLNRVIHAGRVRLELFLRGTNLANQEARPHASFVKELAPLPGRALAAGLRLSF